MINSPSSPRSLSSTSPFINSTSGGGSGRLSPEMTSQIVQSREFSEAVRMWNSETVEKILKNGGIDVDMIISEKVSLLWHFMWTYNMCMIGDMSRIACHKVTKDFPK